MADDASQHFTVSTFWRFKMDGFNLGVFTSVEGLGVEVSVETREEGGNNAFIWQLPGRMKYTPLKLTRPVTKDGTDLLNTYLNSMTGKLERKTATLVALTTGPTGSGSEPSVVATWNFQGVMLTRWTGPQFTTESGKVLTETVEFAHHGFLANASGMSA